MGTSESFAYDSLNRLTLATIAGGAVGSYEKEIRTNGTTEHKHYVRAGGLTFALVVTGTQTVVRVSGGVTTTSFESISRTSYFHNDHLGSIAAITNEAGAVVERLAFDPWGKRRFVNTQPGKADALDAIVGVRTDRGYTGHEHLDEMGVIHGVGIDAVVLGIRADELRTHRAEAIGHGGHQTVVVALDVEHHTAALQHAGCRELSGPIKACRAASVSMGVLRRLRSTRRHRRLAPPP